MKKCKLWSKKNANVHRQKMQAIKVLFICISSRIGFNLKKERKKVSSIKNKH